MSESELERLHQQVLILQRRNDSLQVDVENMDRALRAMRYDRDLALERVSEQSEMLRELRAMRYDRDLALERVSEQAAMLRELETENTHLRKLLGLRDKEVLFDEEVTHG